MSSRARGLFIAFVWVALGGAMSLAALAVELAQNMFDWHSQWSLAATIACVIFALALGASVAMHPATRGPIAMTVALGVTLALLSLGLTRLAPDVPEPGALFGRTLPSPLGYRVGFAVALALPALLLLIRRWKVDESDAWFRRQAPRRLPTVGAVALVLVGVGLTGRHKSDPHVYADAAEVLGGPSAFEALGELALATGRALSRTKNIEELLVPEILEQRMREHMRTPPGTREAEQHDRLERFLDSDRVPGAIKSEVRSACAEGAATHPVRAHACARDVLARGQRRATERRKHFGVLALAGIPFAALALALGWRARRPARSSARD
jgi:hypothetical protein